MSRKKRSSGRAAVALTVCIALVMWPVVAIPAIGMFLFVYDCANDPCDRHTTEREHLVDQIELFHQQHGRYPESKDEVFTIWKSDELDLDEFGSTKDEFSIRLTRHLYVLPGQKIWAYSSTRGTWNTFQETW